MKQTAKGPRSGGAGAPLKPPRTRRSRLSAPVATPSPSAGRLNSGGFHMPGPSADADRRSAKPAERRAAVLGTALLALLLCASAAAIEVRSLEDFAPLFGRYAPGGDCTRQPRIRVDATGFTFEVDGQEEKVTNPEYAASYGGNAYQGITRWFLPLRDPRGFPILLAFNHGEQAGVLVVSGHDEGWPGGPPLSARNRALVDGSPYARCD